MKRLNKKKLKEFLNKKEVESVYRMSVFAVYLMVFSMVLGIHEDDILRFVDKQTGYELSVDDLCNLINESENLNDLEKDYLINEKLFDEVINYVNNGNNGFVLKKHIKNMDITPITEEEIEVDSDILGFYHEFYSPNVLHVKDYNEDDFSNIEYVISHELIHMIEGCPYYYIREGFTSIVNSEYYMSDSSYSSVRTRLKVLMEIVGPEVIWNLVFSRDKSELDSILDNYLSEEDSKELKQLFNTYISDCKDIDSVNERIDELLSVLYYNVYDKPIESDKVIYALYNSDKCKIRRNYFNIYREKDTIKYCLNLETAERLGYFKDGVIFNDDIWVVEDSYEKFKKHFSDYSCIDKSLGSNYFYRVIDDNNYEFTIDGNKTILSTEEAFEREYLHQVVYLRREVKIYDLESIENLLNNNQFVKIPNDSWNLEYKYIFDEEKQEYLIEIEERIPAISNKTNHFNYENNGIYKKLNRGIYEK